jgi:large subunit ribosomal protein L9e
MRDVLKTEELTIPDGVTVDVKSRIIKVTGPKGTLTKNVRHINMDIRILKGKANKVTLAVWQGGRKHVACLRTIRSLIENLITGVTKVRSSTIAMNRARRFIKSGFLIQNACCVRTLSD